MSGAHKKSKQANDSYAHRPKEHLMYIKVPLSYFLFISFLLKFIHPGEISFTQRRSIVLQM